MHFHHTDTATTKYPASSPAERGPCLSAINREIDRLHVPQGINETCIEEMVIRLDRHGDPAKSEFWLLLARLAEMAMLCAGHYADNVEFTAAGDLLVNPKRVIIYQKGYQKPQIKPRHGKVSEVLGLGTAADRIRCRRILQESLVHVEAEALLPSLLKRMQKSRKFPQEHLDRLQNRMKRVADTIGFLSAWGLTGLEDLRQRLRISLPETCDFVSAHLCRFSDTVFRRLGDEIRRQAQNPLYASPFLTSHPVDVLASAWQTVIEKKPSDDKIMLNTWCCKTGTLGPCSRCTASVTPCRRKAALPGAGPGR